MNASELPINPTCGHLFWLTRGPAGCQLEICAGDRMARELDILRVEIRAAIDQRDRLRLRPSAHIVDLPLDGRRES